jgi:hypothetical protein
MLAGQPATFGWGPAQLSRIAMLGRSSCAVVQRRLDSMSKSLARLGSTASVSDLRSLWQLCRDSDASRFASACHGYAGRSVCPKWHQGAPDGV